MSGAGIHHIEEKGNSYPLIDGPATYATMFKAIRNATDHINLETFIMGDIFENDETGLRLTDLLLQKQAEGVQVNLLYDSVGSYNTPTSFFQRLRDGGIDAAEFNPINPLKASRKRRNLLETLSPHLANSEVFMMDFSTV